MKRVDGTGRFSLHNENLLYPVLAFSVVAATALLACSPSTNNIPVATEIPKPTATATLAPTEVPLISAPIKQQEPQKGWIIQQYIDRQPFIQTTDWQNSVDFSSFYDSIKGQDLSFDNTPEGARLRVITRQGLENALKQFNIPERAIVTDLKRNDANGASVDSSSIWNALERFGDFAFYPVYNPYFAPDPGHPTPTPEPPCQLPICKDAMEIQLSTGGFIVRVTPQEKDLLLTDKNGNTLSTLHGDAIMLYQTYDQNALTYVSEKVLGGAAVSQKKIVGKHEKVTVYHWDETAKTWRMFLIGKYVPDKSFDDQYVSR